MLTAKNKKKSRLSNINREYDIIIVGGGITGANILWDATLRGYRCLLLEKSDYASGTSQATSKLIHGGLRYLKNLEFSLVRESLRERRILAKITPHAMRPMGFLIPIRSLYAKLILWAGMFLYNLFSFDRNEEILDEVKIPRYIWNSFEETIYKSPNIHPKNVIGSFQYYDYLNVNPERHTCEFIFSAKKKGAHAYNYAKVSSISKTFSGKAYQVKIDDSISGETIYTQTKVLINSAGPWADYIDALAGIPTDTKIIRSKGIHAVVRNICDKECVVAQKRDGSHLFVIPWRNRTIIGTTDVRYDQHPDQFSVTEKDLQELIDDINYAYGFSNLTLNDIVYFYGGLRPLVEDTNHKDETYSASRKAEIFHYNKDGYPGVFAALGGKYTTSRSVAEKIVNQIDIYFGYTDKVCKTKDELLIGAYQKPRLELIRELQAKFPKVSGRKIEILTFRYGTIAEKMLAKPGKYEIPLANGEIFFEEEIDYLCEEEEIIKASDLFFRRSGIGTVGRLGREQLNIVIDHLAKKLSWDQKRKKEEMAEIEKRYLWNR
ncbi:glycerol-3-phosphate oxidase [Leptospira ryugenii]|uniref:Glycerol-3-phosphate oxidase n=1 Tax=Leptospira ryugenii TaxID=1917863 RepID=A0A2P2E4U9_9LEPT|nr:glycerol-3-phosphate dehydrogenase/oxidase [Leptospira ryugenii]GBF51892.1 glycerol-3-phosphate oxidase [Leptospira ryugenii]